MISDQNIAVFRGPNLEINLTHHSKCYVEIKVTDSAAVDANKPKQSKFS